MPNPTLREICITSAYTLTQAGIDAPALSANLLISHALTLSRLNMVMQHEREISPTEQMAIHTLIQRRANGEPVALIVGHKEFYGRDFAVNAHTLVPRPETEHLIEFVLAQQALAATAPLRFADFGTGSGCIAITVACERPAWQGCMVDIAAEALHMACVNATRHQVADRLTVVQADMTAFCFKNEAFDLILSNPPYVSEDEYMGLPKEIRAFEPRSALQPCCFGVRTSFEPTGLGHIGALAHYAHRYLSPGGHIVVEHGFRQGSTVRELFAKAQAWDCIQTQHDLAGHERFCTARKMLI